MESSPDWAKVRPLTRTSIKTGELYARPADVESQIREAAPLDAESLLQRAALREQDAPGYLKEETLVYLIREYRREGHDRLVNDLSAVLLTRCTPHINRQLRKLSIDRLEEATAEVIGKLFTRILDLDTDRADFFQVRFWLFIDRLISDTRRSHFSQIERAKQEHAPDWIHGSEDRDDGEGRGGYVPPVAAGGMDPDDMLLIHEALTGLEEPYRTLFVLRHYEGWPVESEDPDAPTISRYFGKTPRTIRNWMQEAERRLKIWREGYEA